MIQVRCRAEEHIEYNGRVIEKGEEFYATRDDVYFSCLTQKGKVNVAIPRSRGEALMSIDIGKILEAIGGMVSGSDSEHPGHYDRYRRTLEEIRRIARHQDDPEGRLRAIHEVVDRVLGRRHRDR